jgi:hypothetical protein
MSYSKVNSMSETFTRIEPKYKCADISKEEKQKARKRMFSNESIHYLLSGSPCRRLYTFDGQHYSLRGGL